MEQLPFGITASTWQDKDNFHCAHCAFDSLDLEKLIEHQDRHRAPAPPPVTLYDGNGNAFQVSGSVEPIQIQPSETEEK